MCTVTYLPLGDHDFILTSNRDESPIRKTIPPKSYIENGVELTYPKDKLAGGTWVGLSNKKRLVCLLNGAFIKHKRTGSYKKSRGVIVKMLLKSDDVTLEIKAFDFNNIEPFTVILIDWEEKLSTFELIWDGEKIYFKDLGQKPKIWSSSMLYTNEMKQLREEWFANWLEKNKKFKQEDILNFHQDESKGNKETSLKMKRKYVETVSVTSIMKNDRTITMEYFDFLDAKNNLELLK